ncbi:MAG: thioredoxin domain-containing protein [Candidatus Helarchaeota archaeon]
MTNLNSNENKENLVRIEFFFSPTCPYCKQVKSMLYDAKKIYREDIEIVFIDVSTEQGQILAHIYRIEATPTLIINSHDVIEGLPEKNEIIYEGIEKYLSQNAIREADKRKMKMKKRIDMMYS